MSSYVQSILSNYNILNYKEDFLYIIVLEMK
jgi:hypothetical protein